MPCRSSLARSRQRPGLRCQWRRLPLLSDATTSPPLADLILMSVLLQGGKISDGMPMCPTMFQMFIRNNFFYLFFCYVQMSIFPLCPYFHDVQMSKCPIQWSHLSHVMTIVTSGHTCHIWTHLSHVVTLCHIKSHLSHVINHFTLGHIFCTAGQKVHSLSKIKIEALGASPSQPSPLTENLS